MFKLVAGVAASAFLILGSTGALAQDHYVRGYMRSNGTYVAPHYQTNPNSTTSDNYSTLGNVNPYTGVYGTKPDVRPSYGSSYTAPNYGYSQPRSSYGSSYTAPYGSSYGQPAPTCSGFGC